MSANIQINVHHVTRLEGHGNIVVNIRNGTIEKCQWQVPEAPRFFEAMVRGRRWDDIQTIVSRICGICSITHSLASTKAVEDALGLQVTEQTDMLRILMHYSEQLQSHTLHVGYLVAPDLFGEKSVVPLVAKAPDAVKKIIKAHRIANQWSDLLAGRTTHPVTLTPGGMTKIPTAQELKDLQKTLKEIVPDLVAICEVVHSVADRMPAFERPTEYISLRQDNPPTYTFYHGGIVSSDGYGPVHIRDWESVANEYVSPQSTAKWCRWHRDSYAVGALARFNNNGHLLSPLGKKVADMFGLKKGCCNPFMNNVAQLAEAAHVVEVSIELIDKLLTKGLKDEKVKVTPRAGRGSGCVEAPRGILFHTYEFNKKGECIAANICIPTNQNHANIQKDFEKFVPEYMHLGEDGLRHGMEMLVRSYDPCISCSTHMLNVTFVK
ncbi:MAG TPA: Ni/Fe hydrogenase subunit alpha [Anaerohalosphaeraceae bacterium]|nr:Ni/Fe hydrogenase subunit alpha [Anaerohalosphaeraceae bacterium]HOL87699.1 Ni/Fe hydrogenase subunit alpha [Anaerohalosphaeraceae bacterium]HPP55794.1 Ni/Fe hydrogenase subunit alpha [Anaerohalosphaeraceae bacterium]